MKREGDRRCAAPRREPLVHPHHAEAVAVAVAEPVDGVDAHEDIKTGSFLLLSQNHVWQMSKRQTQTPTTSAQDEGWDGTVHGGFQERVSVVDGQGYVEDAFQSRRQVRQTTGGRL